MDIDKLKPLNGNILVQDDLKKEEKTDAGIILLENRQDDHILKGKILEISGPWIDEKGTRREIREVKPGDTVIYSFTAGAGSAWIVEKETYRVIKPVEILGKLVD